LGKVDAAAAPSRTAAAATHADGGGRLWSAAVARVEDQPVNQHPIHELDDDADLPDRTRS
jgi:hypothetical protein